jgi:hypothetical protein
MVDNIVGQLRTAAIMQRHEEVYCPDLLREAANEIQSLRARVAELERAAATSTTTTKEQP